MPGGVWGAVETKAGKGRVAEAEKRREKGKRGKKTRRKRNRKETKEEEVEERKNDIFKESS